MAKLTQKQVEDWIAQNGGPQAVQYGVEQKQVRNPSADAVEQALQPYVTIQVEVWRNTRTGAELSARRGDDGDFDVIESKNADPNKPSGNDDTPDRRNAAELQRQRERNAALPPDQDPAYETDAERRKRAEDRIAQQGRDAEAARQRQRQDEAAARANQPKPQQQPDGSWGYWDTQPGQQPRWVAIQGGPGAETKPVQGPDGSWGYWKPGANGAAPTWVPIDGPTKQPVKIPASLQNWRPDPSVAGHGLLERRTALFQAAERGEIRYEDIPSILQQDIGLAESVAQQQIREQTESRNLRNEQRADRNTALNIATSRQGYVGNLMQESRAQAQPFVGKVAPPPGSSIAGGAMRTQYELTRAMGGYDVPPDVEMPAFAQNAVKAGQQAAAPARPNAIGVSPTAPFVQPTGAQVEAANQQAQSTFQNAIGPLLKPPPQEGAPEASMPAWGRNAMASVPPAERLRMLGYPDDVIQEALSRGGMVA